MTKKDYELVASVLSKRMTEIEQGFAYRSGDYHAIARAATVEAVAVDLASAFGQGNPRFKRDLFLRACGVSDAS